MNAAASLTRVAGLRKTAAIAFSIATLSLALPATSFAQGNSNNTPAADHSKSDNKGGHGTDNGNHGGGTAPVPEPATWASMATLAILAGALARRQYKKRQAQTTA